MGCGENFTLTFLESSFRKHGTGKAVEVIRDGGALACSGHRGGGETEASEVDDYLLEGKFDDLVVENRGGAGR